MFFKNLQCYRLPAGWDMTAARLAEMLAPNSFTPASSNELLRMGWEAPRDDGALAYGLNGQILLKLVTEKKLLPASVINQVAKAKAAEMEEAQGFAPGKKAMKELKERVADELLPRAFAIRSQTFVWIDPVNGWLVVDSASAARADDVIKLLLKGVDRMPLESVRVARSPSAVMTAWLQNFEAPSGFTVDQDATLVHGGDSKKSVTFKGHDLDRDDVQHNINSGKQVTKLAMTWRDKISFVLTESLAIKSVKPLDVIREGATAKGDSERFDSDFALMTGELAQMLADIMEALGGECGDLVSPAPADPKLVQLAAKMYDTRDAVKARLGDKYYDTMFDLAVPIAICMKDYNLNAIGAAGRMVKTIKEKDAQMEIIAAAVEMVEPERVAA